MNDEAFEDGRNETADEFLRGWKRRNTAVAK